MIELDCTGCGHPLDSEVGYGAIGGLYGLLCPTCFKLLTKQQGRYCNACIRAAYDTSGQRCWIRNRHRMRHSKILNHCVDRDIVPFLDGFNQHVTRTFASCQGEARLPSMPPMPAWINQPYVMVTSGTSRPGDVDAALTWAAANQDRYKITAVEQRWDFGHSMSMRFSETPAVWLD